MIKYLLLGSIFIAVSVNAQVQKQTDKKSNSKNILKNKTYNSATVAKVSTDEKRLIQSQRNIRIEIINSGDWDQFKQTSWWRIVKVNDGNLSQILKVENDQLHVSENTMGTNNWKDENGNFSFRSISESLKISQEFTSIKNDKSENRSLVLEKEFFETTAPITSFSFKIYTHPKNNKSNTPRDLSKVINIYSYNELIKTFIYSYNDLMQTGGISVDNFQIKTPDSK